MSLHLPGKISRLIGDFATVCALVDLIEHELEKRVIARHGLVKLDAILNILPRLKNEIRLGQFAGSSAPVAELDRLIARLRLDYTGSDMEAGRDSFAAHALKLDLDRIVQTWKSMGATNFGVLLSDLWEIDAELKRFCTNYPGAITAPVNPNWPSLWEEERLLGRADRPRMATIYPGLATAGICAPLPGLHPAQDVSIRAIGVATFIRQTRLLWDVVEPSSTVGRLMAEIALNDYLALWELLFKSGIRNEHGTIDQSVADHWLSDGWKGAACLAKLEQEPHSNLENWRRLRNKFTAHIDPDEEIWNGDLRQWPMKPAEIFDESLRVISRIRDCARTDIRSKFLFMPPTHIPSDDQYEVIGLSAQEGRHWSDA